MEQLPPLDRLSEPEKDTLIQALWAETQALKTRIAELAVKLQKPRKAGHNSSVPPSKTPKANQPPRNPRGVRPQASVGRAGGGRPFDPDPDQSVVVRVKDCPYCSQEVVSEAQKLHAVYDKIEVPPLRPILTRVMQYRGQYRVAQATAPGRCSDVL